MKTITKQEALKRSAELEKELQELKAIIDAPIHIMGRVKTLEDAIKILGGVSENVKMLLDYNGNDADVLASQAHLKLTLIARALNEGWYPDWNDDDEYKWVPVFTDSELVYFDADYWNANTHVGSRLCFKSEELAKYAATQFADIYSAFLK